MSSSALTIYNQFDNLQKAASALQASGYFADVKSQAQAIVKVMAGAELGLPPFASMTGIHIIQGKPALGANVIATLVKNDPRYDYRVVTCDASACKLTWFENGKPVGDSTFTMKEAQEAGLTGKDNWRKFPSDMLFARAITRGARRFAPGIFGGSPVYTPDELGADVDPEGYVDAVATDVTPEPPATPEQIMSELGYSPEPPAAQQQATASVRLVTIGKAKYPEEWGKAIAAAGLYSKDVNSFEIDGILKKLDLPHETPAAEIVQAIGNYLANK